MKVHYQTKHQLINLLEEDKNNNSLITSSSYSYVVDGYCFEKIDKNFILLFTIIDYIIYLIARSVELFSSSILINYSVYYLFIFSAVITAIDILISFYIVNNKNKDKLKDQT